MPVASDLSAQTRIIDLAAGERPVLGSGPTAFWVMNDVGNVRYSPSDAPLGIEVRVTAFAGAEGPLAFRQATFYRVSTVNRGAGSIQNLRIGVFADADLGNGQDDYAGFDAARGLSYVYNGAADDAAYGVPPAVGVDMLSGRLSASSVLTNGADSGTRDPAVLLEVANRLRGLWNDGSEIRSSGNGYLQSQGEPTVFMFTGDPVLNHYWSEVNPGFGTALAPGDRRFVMATSPGTLEPGAEAVTDFALVFAQGTSSRASVTALRRASDQVQRVYDAGTLFSGSVPVTMATPPPLVAPADGATFAESAVTFSWQPVGSTTYLLEISPTPDFAAPTVQPVRGTSVTLPVTSFPANSAAQLYWRVRTEVGGLEGPPSAARTFRAYRYQAGTLLLASGAPAFVETTAPGGGPACDPGDPDEGCAEVSGDLVAASLNSTGDFAMNDWGGGSRPALTGGPEEYEIRFTAQGGYAFIGSSLTPSTTRIFRVPFEVWNVGIVAPGSANDPSDDRQMIPRVFGAGNGCVYDYVLATRLGIGPSTPYLSVNHAVNDDYAPFASFAAAAVAAAPDGCAASNLAGANAFIDRVRPVALYGQGFEQASTRPITGLAGTTVRFHTTDRLVGAEAAPEAGAALALGAAFPNPARGAVTVPYAVAAPGAVRLRLVDVLGRTVLVLADGPSAAGPHEVRVDTRALAPGVYAVVLDGDAGRTTRTLTVVR